MAQLSSEDETLCPSGYIIYLWFNPSSWVTLDECYTGTNEKTKTAAAAAKV